MDICFVFFVFIPACIHLSGNSMSMSSEGTTHSHSFSLSPCAGSVVFLHTLILRVYCGSDLSEEAVYSPVSGVRMGTYQLKPISHDVVRVTSYF